MRTRLLSAVQRTALLLFAATVAGSSPGVADGNFDTYLRQLDQNQVTGYLQPFADLTGANYNTGWYQSAHIPTTGFNLDFRIIVMGGSVGDEQKEFDLPLPAGFSSPTMKSPTIFGKPEGATYTDPNTGLRYSGPGGIFNTSLAPAAAPQLRIGSLYGTEAIIRFILLPEAGEIPRGTLFGIGARHSISQYFPELPLDIAAGGIYHTGAFGDYVDLSTLALGAQASKNLGVVTLFGGIQYEMTTMDVSYTTSQAGTPVNVSLDGDRAFTFTAGADFHLGPIRIHADANLGSVMNFTGSIGFGI
jgi:hypothetical protein